MERKSIDFAGEIAIIPDVHGRGFWRDSLESLPEGHLVFLGDYLDPYEDEGIDNVDAYMNLADIVAVKKEHPEKVSLLWGNHDLHYLYRNLRGTRMDSVNWHRFNQFFWQNRDCFQLAEEALVCGRRYLFTHAGVGRKWAGRVCEKFAERAPTASELNELMDTPAFIDALGAISYRRGGWSEYGSMIWADCREHMDEDNQYGDVVQIFGHTQLDAPVNFEDRIYCLDCRRCFRINPEDGNIEAL